MSQANRTTTTLPRRTSRLALGAIALLALGGCAAHSSHPGWTGFGAVGGTTDHREPTSIASLDGSERDIALAGTIGEVCLVKGCWMTLTDDAGDTIFVRFRDYAFFVPRNAAGHRAVLRGDAKARTVSVELLRHFAEDARRSPEEIAAITEPETRVEFLATAVWIEGSGLDRPWSERTEPNECTEE